MNIHFTEYLQYRAKIRGFDLKQLEDILRYSPERYYDTETGRSIVVGKYQDKLILIPYEKNKSNITPILVKAAELNPASACLLAGPLTCFKYQRLRSV